jgi:hypothetical protein
MNVLRGLLLLKWRRNTTRSFFKWLADRVKLRRQSLVHWDLSKNLWAWNARGRVDYVDLWRELHQDHHLDLAAAGEAIDRATLAS